MYHSWFSLDGVNDFGNVTLACDDDKQVQAHKVVKLPLRIFSLFSLGSLDRLFFVPQLVQLGWCE